MRATSPSNYSCAPFNGEWRELGRIETGWDSFSLDGTTFSHQGRRYFVWTQRGRTPVEQYNEGRGTKSEPRLPRAKSCSHIRVR
jgi:GH43 family beta-xylosidase